MKDNDKYKEHYIYDMQQVQFYLQVGARVAGGGVGKKNEPYILFEASGTTNKAFKLWKLLGQKN